MAQQPKTEAQIPQLTPPAIMTDEKLSRVERDVLLPRFVCGLCRKLLRDATTIIECLHSFCRKCIYNKFNDDDADDCFECPVCHTHLGAIPVEKLRADHNLQELRTKLFPHKKRKVENSEVVQPIPLPVRRKERSLSSLVVDSPRTATQTGLTGRRTKTITRRSATVRGLSPATDLLDKKEDSNFDKLVENPNSADCKQTLDRGKQILDQGQTSSGAEPSNNASKKDAGIDGDVNPDTTELWNRLNCLVEVANGTKSFKSAQQTPLLKTQQSNGHVNEGSSSKTKVKEHPQNSKVQNEKIQRVQTTPATKVRRFNRASRKRKDLETSSHVLLEAARARDRRITPIWFTLVASVDQSGCPTLPQIQANYLRIKDYNMPASVIQKYLAMKFGLANETEVEITCRGEPIKPTSTLHTLIEQWTEVGSSQMMQKAIGASAEEFVMVLSYGRSKVSSQ